MSEQLTREQVEELLRKAEAADLPWYTDGSMWWVENSNRQIVAECGSWADDDADQKRKHCDYIRAACNSIPALCRDWLRLMGEIEALRKSQTAARPRGGAQ